MTKQVNDKISSQASEITSKMGSLIVSKAFCIPEDIIREILLRLPVKSLLRFKCVNRLWCDIISSSDFISTHLNKYASNYMFINRESIFSLLLPTSDADTAINVRISSKYPLSNYSVLGTRNGIICLKKKRDYKNENDMIILWNPATRDCKLLPQSNINYKKTSTTGGFGFDSKSNNYMVLQYVYGSRNYALYSLSSDSWKILQPSEYVMDMIQYYSVKYECTNLALKEKNIICWLFIVDKMWEIVYFDFSNEKFDFVPLPEDIAILVEDYYGLLFPLKNSLALITFPQGYKQEDMGLYNIWVNEDFSCERSLWTKLLTIRDTDIGITIMDSPFSGLAAEIFGNGQLIFVDEDLNYIFYDVLTSKKFKLQLNYEALVYDYKESLVSISQV